MDSGLNNSTAHANTDIHQLYSHNVVKASDPHVQLPSDGATSEDTKTSLALAQDQGVEAFKDVAFGSVR